MPSRQTNGRFTRWPWLRTRNYANVNLVWILLAFALKICQWTYLDRFVFGSFITMASFNSPNLPKYSFRPSEMKITDCFEYKFDHKCPLNMAFFEKSFYLFQNSPILHDSKNFRIFSKGQWIEFESNELNKNEFTCLLLFATTSRQ